MGGPNSFPDSRDRNLLIVADEYERQRARASHIVGQLAFTGLENVRLPSNKDVIYGAVNDGSIPQATADSELDALSMMDARPDYGRVR